MKCLFAWLLVGIAAAATPAQACSPPPAVDTRFFLFEVPAGGLWWVHGMDARLNAEGLPLVDEVGNETEVAVVSLGTGGSAALRVPDVAVGTRFVFPDSLQRPQDSAYDEFLVVGAGNTAQATDPPPAPAITIELREVSVGYESVLVSPIGGECEAATGFWDIHYADRPFLIVDMPGDDVVLDVQLQPAGEEAFENTNSANEILFDGRIAAAVDTVVNAPADAVDAFNVHARTRRISDCAFSEVVTIEVAIDDAPAEVRNEYVGCSHATTRTNAPMAIAPMAIGATALVTRRRRSSAVVGSSSEHDDHGQRGPRHEP